MEIGDICCWRASKVNETLSGVNDGNLRCYLNIAGCMGLTNINDSLIFECGTKSTVLQI